MSDNWTASPVALAGQGDWAKWTVTLGSSEVDALNDVSGVSQVMLRYGLTASGDVNNDRWCVMINDWMSILQNDFVSPTTWNSAGRFRGIENTTPGALYTLLSLSDSGAAAQQVFSPYSVAPWQVGTNIIRVLNLTNVQIDIDFLSLFFTAFFGPLGDQFTAETVNPAFASHVNGAAFGTATAAWFLHGSDATTGTAAVGVVDFDKLCPVGTDQYRAQVHVHDGALEASGDVGGNLANQGTPCVRATLDGTGRAVLVGPGGPSSQPNIWYGGSDAIGPELIIFPSWPLPWKGCGGWYWDTIAMST